MKKYIIKNINGIICFCLITVILVLALAVLKNENKAIANSPIPGENLEGTSVTIPDTPTESLALSYKMIMPKPACADESFLFCQDICGIGNINLKAMHQTSLGIYIVASSQCVYGDIAGIRPGIGIAQLDTLGNVKSTFYIPSQSTSEYVCSQITALGIVVITSDIAQKQYFVNVINYDLSSYNTIAISSGLNARIVSTSTSFLILTEYAEETIIYDYVGGKLKFYSMGAISLVDLFEYGSYYLMFSNKNNGYCVTKVSKSSYNIIEEKLVPSVSLIAVKPAMENGSQVFILIESSDATYAKKVDGNLNFANATVKKLGNFSIKAISHGQNEFLIIASGNINGLITLDYDLNVSYSEYSSSIIINEIFHSAYYKGVYYYLANTQDNKLCLIKIDNGNTTFSYLQVCGTKATFAINSNDTLVLIYSGNFYEYESVQIKGLVL